MTVDLVPIFQDNYVFVIRGPSSSAVVVDPGDAAPVLGFLEREKLNLEAILITHHHPDHVGGVADLLGGRAIPVYGPVRDVGRWSFDLKGVREGDVVEAAGTSFEVFEVPGHTHDHIAYWNAREKVIFSGDVLFGLGCGRLFEGTAAEMFASLSKIKRLPPETRVYCTHEYTEKNFGFVEHEAHAIAMSPAFANYTKRMRDLRARGRPTVPLVLGDEIACNPLLAATSAEDFRDWRKRRDFF